MMQSPIRDTSAQDVPIDNRDVGNRLRWLRWALPVAAAMLLGIFLIPALTTWMSAEASVPSDRIRVAVVERGDLVRDLNVQGRVVAAVSPTLYSPATGTVTLQVQPGDRVVPDQTLATVDSPELRSRLLQEQSTLDRLQAELERQRIEARKAAVKSQQIIDLARVELTAAEREMRRAEKSIETNAISEMDFERARDELAREQVKYQHAVQDAELEGDSLAFEEQTRQLAIDRQRLVVKELSRRVEDLAIRSPVEGIVGNVAVAQKAVVDENAPLVTVVDLSAFEIEVRIPESYADDLGIGLGADIKNNQDHYRGQLISLSAEVVDSEVTGRIRFAGAAPPGLRQNQRLGVRLMVDELAGVLKVRRGAFADSGSGRVAFVLDGDGLAQRRAVRLGARSASEVEVLSGLAEGERIIVSSIADFEDFQTIHIVD